MNDRMLQAMVADGIDSAAKAQRAYRAYVSDFGKRVTVEAAGYAQTARNALVMARDESLALHDRLDQATVAYSAYRDAHATVAL